jgi:hypothetical protein
MPRVLALLLSLALPFAGCFTPLPPNSGDDGGTILPGGPEDLSVAQSPDLACSGGTVCSGVCTNTSYDPNNCGTCNHVCPTGQPCIGGVCGGSSTLTGCNGIVVCANPCQDANCIMACLNNATTAGKNLFMALGQCLQMVCPDMQPTDICGSSSTASQCQACVTAAQMPNGWCYSQTVNCANSKP